MVASMANVENGRGALGTPGVTRSPTSDKSSLLTFLSRPAGYHWAFGTDHSASIVLSCVLPFSSSSSVSQFNCRGAPLSTANGDWTCVSNVFLGTCLLSQRSETAVL